MSDNPIFLLIQGVSRWAIPMMVVMIPLYAHRKGVPVYERFVEGAREGLLTAARITPYLVAMLVAIALMRSSGTLDLILAATQPVLSFFGIPAEVLPLVLVRPFSGSGALSVTSELMQTHGADTPIGLLASILMGSTETTFYVVTVYLGAIGLQQARHGLTAALVGDVTGFIGAILVWRLFFA